MHAIVIIEIDQSSMDTVIIWGDDSRLVAIGYLDGKPQITRPLVADTVEAGVAEARDVFHIETGRLANIRGWTARLEAPFPTVPDTWQI